MKATLLLISFFLVACSANDNDTDPLDEEFGVSDGKTDSNGFTPGSPEALAIVEFVNQPIQTKTAVDKFEKLLDSKLNRIAAENIVKFRIGDDGKVKTSDDAVFANIQQVDKVRFVGKFALRALFELAKAEGYFNQKGAAKRIILFVGDGMGVGAISGTQYLANEKLNMLSMPELGWMSTHSHEFVTTDSAASASALASGRKTHFNGVSVVPGTEKREEEDPQNHLESFFDIAKTQGMGRGIVATTRVVHATPAAFYAHRKTRKSYEEIAEDLVSADLDVVLGSGWRYFRDRKDQVNLIDKFEAAGVDYFEDAKRIDEFANSSTKLMGLFDKQDMPLLTRGPRKVSLKKMVETAITVLDRGNPKGWVLMVEGSYIDWCEHDLRPNCTFLETKDFDEAVGVGLDYANNRSAQDTLIVVTADHETGGLSIIDSKQATALEDAVRSQNTNPTIEEAIARGRGFKVGKFFDTPDGPTEFNASFGSMSQASKILSNQFFFSAAHTPNFVPIFAQGPSSKFIAASKDNARLGLNLKRVLSQEILAEEKDEGTPKNIVLVLGERLGVAAVTIGNYSHGESQMLEMKEHGLISPANIGGGIVPSTNALLIGKEEFDEDNLLSLAAKKGKSIAVISDRLDSPVLKIVEKNKEKVEFVLGFDSENSDTGERFETLGYNIENTWPPTNADNIFGNFGSLRGANSATSLIDAYIFAIDRLSKNDDGYVIILDLSSAVDESEMLEKLKNLNATISKALEQNPKDTLVLVTGDRDQTMSVIDNHYSFESKKCNVAERCGGSFEYEDHEVVKRGGFLDKELQGEDFTPLVMVQYAWLVHASADAGEPKNSTQTYSENFLPLFAQGAGSSLFRGFHNQKEIGNLLNEFVK